MRRLTWSLVGGMARFCCVSVALMAWCLSTPVHAAEPANLNYDVDAALIYFEALRGPHSRAGMVDGAAIAPLALASQPHTLGLRRLALGLTWQASAAAGLHLVLRPDAVNRHDEAGGTLLPVREVDTRSSDGGLQPLPTIRLLDEYQLVLRARPGASLGFGVWSGLEPTELAYPELLGFGLKVLFPAKFSGLRLAWQPLSQEPDRAGAAGAGAKSAPMTGELFLLQGNEDRAEALVLKSDSHDVAPSARDPYYGAACRFSARPGFDLNLGLILGYLDQSDAEGRYDAVFGQLSAVEDFPVAGRHGRVNLEARYLRSRGHYPVAAQTLTSASMTAAIAVAADLWALVGIDYGKGDRWTSDRQRDTSRSLQGYELEAGVFGPVGGEVSLQLLISREFRILRDARGKSGGFQDEAGARSGLNRIGLEVTYRLNKNA